MLGGRTATGQNLTGSYTDVTAPGFQLLVEAPGMDYGSLLGAPAVAGGRLTQALGSTAGSATVSIDQDVVVDPGSGIFFSALFRFDDSVNGNHRASITLTDDGTGNAITFGEPTVGMQRLQVAVELASGTTLAAAGADLAFVGGDRLLLVGRYANSPIPGADELQLLGYDVTDADLLPQVFDPADPNAEFSYAVAGLDIDITRLGSVTFSMRGSANNWIDELRIGTSYGVVVPEPATGWLLGAGAGALGLVAAVRRRYR